MNHQCDLKSRVKHSQNWEDTYLTQIPDHRVDWSSTNGLGVIAHPQADTPLGFSSRRIN